MVIVIDSIVVPVEIPDVGAFPLIESRAQTLITPLDNFVSILNTKFPLAFVIGPAFSLTPGVP